MGSFIWNPWHQALASLWPDSAATEKLAPLASEKDFHSKPPRKLTSAEKETHCGGLELLKSVLTVLKRQRRFRRNYWLLQLCNDVRTLEACTVDSLSCAPRSCYCYCFSLTDEIKVGEMSALPKENKIPNIHLKYKLAWATTTREKGGG